MRSYCLTLLTQTSEDVKEYGGHSQAVVSLLSAVIGVGECQADAENTGGRGHSQPQAVAERSSVAVPG
jgi:hypothetical protein